MSGSDEQPPDDMARPWQVFWNPIKQIDFDALSQAAAAIRSELDLQRIAAGDSDPQRKQLETLIDEKLRELDPKRSIEQNWCLVNHAERLLLPLLPETRVRLELRRRADRLRGDGAPFAEFYHEALEALAEQQPGAEELGTAWRELLSSMVGDLQDFTGRRFIRRRYARLAVYKVGAAFVGAFTIFLIVLAVGHWHPTAASDPRTEALHTVSEEGL